VPELAHQVLARFPEEAGSRSGRIARLFVCADRLQMIRRFGDHPDLEVPLRRAGTELEEGLR
jgi:hypothetical protein